MTYRHGEPKMCTAAGQNVVLDEDESDLDVVAPASAVMRSSRRVASVVASMAGSSVAVTSRVVLSLDNDSIAVTVVSVDEQSEQLRMVSMKCQKWARMLLTKVMKKKMMFIMARAKQALSMAHVLLICSDQSLPLWRP